MKTRADTVGNDKYLINGQKVFTSGMDISDYCLVVLRTSKEDKKQKGITTFMVDTKKKGIDVKKIDTLGHAQLEQLKYFIMMLRYPRMI